jgi:hypothetical protein
VWFRRFKITYRLGHRRSVSPAAYDSVVSFCTVLVCTLLSVGLTVITSVHGFAQDPSERLQNERPNDYRGAKKVSSLADVKKNMQDLFQAILLTGPGDGAKDKWYSPHLRDATISIVNRLSEGVGVRGWTIPEDFMFSKCWNLFGPTIRAACPGPKCIWHGRWGERHRPWSSCFQRNTRIYRTFLNDNNWKTCCVREGQEILSSEQIATLYPDGDGWSGLVEVNYPVTAFGWENDRTTTMIADQGKVNKCISDVEQQKLMEGPAAQAWVAGAIGRNIEAVGDGAGDVAGVSQKVAKDISEVRPQNPQNRFSDNLNNIGLTVRPHFAALQASYRTMLAQRFCGRPEQFYKLMTALDPTQLGGGLSDAALDNMPMWANYCPEAVNLMTLPPGVQARELKNLDPTPTKFDLGIAAWLKDPLYCQKMHLQKNPNLAIKSFDVAIMQRVGPILNPAQVGFTCLANGNLNASMVPLSFTRNSFVERRTAIADQAIGFLIAAGIAPGMHVGNRSYIKRFEPQPYSMGLGPYRAFTGKRMRGAGTNELERVMPAFSACAPLAGENLQFKNKADRIYLSNKTHGFTQEIIDERNSIDKYVQDWAEADKKKQIAERGLNERSLNYGTAFRVVAMCPAGWVRWRPPPDEHDGYLSKNVQTRCEEEFFGGLE